MLPRSALPDPKLVDVVDDEWMEDKLPDDGASRRKGCVVWKENGADLKETDVQTWSSRKVSHRPATSKKMKVRVHSDG